MNSKILTRAKRIAVATVAAGALSISSLAVAQSAFAATPRPGTGDGTLTIENTTVEPQGTLKVKGTGFKQNKSLCFKLDDSNDIFKVEEQTDATVASGGAVCAQTEDHLPDANGNFSLDLKLPQGLALGGHWIRLLDSNPVVSKYAEFTIAEVSAGKVSVGTTSTANDGSTTADLAAAGLSAEAEVKAALGETALSFKAGRSTAESTKVDAEGKLSATLVIPDGVAPAGEHKVKVTVGGDSYEVTVKTSVGLKLKPNAFRPNASQGETIDFEVHNLPKGAIVKAVGEGSTNWLAAALPAATETTVTGKLTVPTDAPLGKSIYITYTTNGSDQRVETANIIYPNTSDLNAKDFDVTKITVPKGNYQSAYNPETNALFVTSSVGRPPIKESALTKLDATTLQTLASVTPAVAVEKTGFRYAVYGIGLDNAHNVVWVSNTRQNTVAAYSQDDLKLIKQFEDGSTTHGRDFVIDAKTGYAYVSSSDRGTKTSSFIDIYKTDGTTDGTVKVGRLNMGTEKINFRVVMSLDLDQETQTLYTVSMYDGQAAAIDLKTLQIKDGVATANTTYFDLGDRAQEGSGVGYDSATGRLFISSQQTANVLVVNTKTGKVEKDISTGYGSLNVAVDQANRLVYVVNFFSDSLTVIDPDTLETLGQLGVEKIGLKPNHVAMAGDYAIVVNKDGGANDAGDSLHKVRFIRSTGSADVSETTITGETTTPKTPTAVKETVKLSFDAAGGTPTPETQEVVKGTTGTKPAVDPKRDGYKFAGWFTKDAKEAFNFDTAIGADITLYAHWDKVDQKKATGKKLAKTGSVALTLGTFSALALLGGSALVVARRRRQG